MHINIGMTPNNFSPSFPGLAGPSPMENVTMMLFVALAQMAALVSTEGQPGSGLANPAPSFGSGSGGSGIPNFLGGGQQAGSASGLPASGGGSGQAAVDYARQFNGQDSSSVKGKMKHFTAAGGITNNCCDFVSAALEGQGLVKGHHINVKSFEQELKKQGYRQVPASQARPGDVWINHSRGHTELVASKGATRLIGSNNNGDKRQEITEHANRPGSGIIYQKG